MRRKPGACIIAAQRSWENREKHSWASRTVSAMGNRSVSRRRPRPCLASGAAVLWRGPEAAGVADAMIKAWQALYAAI